LPLTRVPVYPTASRSVGFSSAHAPHTVSNPDTTLPTDLGTAIIDPVIAPPDEVAGPSATVAEPNAIQGAVQESDTISIIQRGDRTWWIVGTAHVSQESVEEVRRVIQAVRPDTVAVELCEPRYESMMDEDRWKKLDLYQVIRQGRTLFLLMSLALGAYQRRLGAKLGVKPGAELLEAVHVARETGAELSLIDRNINATLKRAWASVGFWKKSMLLAGITDSLIGQEEVSTEQIEDLKNKAKLTDVMSQFAEALPEVKGALIDERDRFMVSRLHDAPGKRIVAVVGAGHVPGMLAGFDKPEPTASLEELPPPAWWSPILKWSVPVLLVASLVWGWQLDPAGGTVEDLLWAWIAPHVIGGVVSAIIAGATIPSILVSAVVSPFTPLNPLLAAGMFTGITEAWMRKPKVEDAERIPDDVQSIGGVYRNPVTRVMLVAIMTNFGAVLANFISASWILSVFGRAVA
jgi:pheromone shutdown-related protein TraB